MHERASVVGGAVVQQIGVRIVEEEMSISNDAPTLRPPDGRLAILPLTGLRGAFALWVVMFHITAGLELLQVPVASRLSQYLTNILHSGALAVEGFFILSGFVMSYAHADEFTRHTWYRNSWRFWGLRLARIYPVHVAVLICYVALNAAGFDWMVRTCGNPANRPAGCDRFSTEALIEQVLLVSSWGLDPQVGWNFVSWSISSEWFAYLCFPLALLVVARVRPRLALIAGVTLLGAMIPTLMMLAPRFHGLADDYGLLRVVPTFLCGCLLFRVYGSPQFEHVRWPIVSAFCLLAVVGLVASAIFAMSAVLALAPLILSLASRQRNMIGMVLSTGPAQWLGRISYSLYMTHFLVLEVMDRAIVWMGKPLVFKTTPRLIGAYLVSLIVTVSVAAVFYVLIEEPARKYLRARLSRRLRNELAT